MLYLLHGEDEYSRNQRLAEIRAQLGADGSLVALDTTVLDGEGLAPEALRAACETLPFLAPRRLVIVEGLAALCEPRRAGSGEGAEMRPGKMGRDKVRAFADAFARVPASTDLVLVEVVNISKANPIAQAVEQLGGRVERFQPPRREDEVRRFILAQVAQRGSQISPPAVDELVAFVGPNRRLLEQEIEKLATFAGGRTITAQDVGLLVSYAREARIFALVDALGLGDRRASLRLLYRLLAAGEPPPLVLYMIVRQFRLILRLKELARGGASPDQIAAEVRLPVGLVKSLQKQAQRFSPPQLRAIFRHLLAADVALKSGRMEADLLLDLLVLWLTERQTA